MRRLFHHLPAAQRQSRPFSFPLNGGPSLSPSRPAGAAPFLPSRLREGLGEGLSARRALPGRAAAGFHPASPASGGGEELRRLFHHFPAAQRESRPFSFPLNGGPSLSPSRPAGAAPFLPSRLREGLGEGLSTRRALPGCAAAGPHPASPASGGGEELRRLFHHLPAAQRGRGNGGAGRHTISLPAWGGRPSTPPPSRLREGLGEGPPARLQKGRRRRAAAAWVSLPSMTRPA